MRGISSAFWPSVVCALLCFNAGLSAQDVGIGPDRETLEARDIARLRALDKITARITELSIPVGQATQFGTLEIAVDYCRSRPPIETPESYVFLRIDDVGLTERAERRSVFEGWMLASSPALNPLEHPVYDVWLMDCKTVAPDASSGSR